MAAHLKGKVSVDFKGKRMTLALDFNALCEFEALTGKNALATISDMTPETARVTDLRALVCAALRSAHPETTLIEAGELLSENTSVWTDLLAASSPEAPAGKPQRPSKARAK